MGLIRDFMKALSESLVNIVDDILRVLDIFYPKFREKYLGIKSPSKEFARYGVLLRQSFIRADMEIKLQRIDYRRPYRPSLSFMGSPIRIEVERLHLAKPYEPLYKVINAEHGLFYTRPNLWR